jgi:hypothetical protein
MDHIWESLETMRLQEDDIDMWGDFDPKDATHCEWIEDIAQARII